MACVTRSGSRSAHPQPRGSRSTISDRIRYLVPPQAIPGRRDQDQPFLLSGPDRRSRRHGHSAGRSQSRPRSRPEHRRGRNRDLGPGDLPQNAGLRPWPRPTCSDAEPQGQDSRPHRHLEADRNAIKNDSLRQGYLPILPNKGATRKAFAREETTSTAGPEHSSFATFCQNAILTQCNRSRTTDSGQTC